MPARFRSPIFALSLLALAGCNSAPPASPAIGVAFVAPMQLNLRKELAPKSPVSVTVKHGERLDVLATRRRFIKVRTAQNAEGWTDAGQLLSQAQMDGLKKLSEQCKSLPSQGAATVYDDLNIHTEPARTAPSFDKITDKMKVDVIGYQTSPKLAPRSVPVFEQPAMKEVAKKARTSKKLPPPPMPAAPKLPENWLEISQVDEEELAEKTAAKNPPKPEAPVVMDDWNLIRTADGKAGWVLARMLVMAIPDEVAQYAEGRRIAAYLPLGEVSDGGQIHPNYVWATVGKGTREAQYDSFRVFVWSTKHHRYETAYVERNVRGYYPLEVSTTGDSPSFSVVVEDKTAGLVRKKFVFSGFHVRLIGKDPYQPVKLTTQLASRSAAPQATPEAAVKGGWGDTLKGWKEKVFGGGK